MCADAGDVAGEGLDVLKALAEHRGRGLPLHRGKAGAAPLRAALAPRPALEEFALGHSTRKTLHRPLAHGPDTLDIHADGPVVDAHEHRAARVAEVELHLGMLRKLGLAILIIGQRRQLTPAVKSVEPEPKRRVGADRLMTAAAPAGQGAATARPPYR